MKLTLAAAVASVAAVMGLLIGIAPAEAALAVSVGSDIRAFDQGNSNQLWNIYSLPQTNANNAFGRPDISELVITDNQATPNVLFKSFCLEVNEFLDANHRYTVSSIQNSAVGGGTTSFGGPNPDPISNFTAALYQHWSVGDLGVIVVGFQYNNDNWAQAVQMAVWNAEQELASPTTPPANIPDLGPTVDAEIAQINLAITAFVGGAANAAADYAGTQVVAINIVDPANGNKNAQSFLGYNPSGITLPLPEPASMLIWTIGVVGIGGISRFRRQRQSVAA